MQSGPVPLCSHIARLDRTTKTKPQGLSGPFRRGLSSCSCVWMLAQQEYGFLPADVMWGYPNRRSLCGRWNTRASQTHAPSAQRRTEQRRRRSPKRIVLKNRFALPKRQSHSSAARTPHPLHSGSTSSRPLVSSHCVVLAPVCQRSDFLLLPT